jgi:hypothetical protein
MNAQLAYSRQTRSVPAGEVPQLYTVAQFAEKHRAIKEAQLRWLIFNRELNGLGASGAIIRLGRRVYLSEQEFFAWLLAQQKAATKSVTAT